MLEGIWSFVIQVRDQNMNLQGESVKSLHGFCFHSRETWQSSRATDSTEVVATDSPLHVFEPLHHTSIFSKEKCSSKMIALPFQDINVAGFQSIVNHFSHVMFGKASPFLPSGLKNQNGSPFHSTGIGARRSVESQGAWFFSMEKLESLELEARCCESSLVASNLNVVGMCYHLDICLVFGVYQLDLLMCLFMHVFS